MIYQVDRLMRDVRVCMDQNMSSHALTLEGDVDTLSLDDIIRSKIVDGVRRVHLMAPYYLLEEGHNFGEELYWGELFSGWVLLPRDFMRLVVFEMDDWCCPVHSALSVTDADTKKQHSRFRGIRGTYQRPVCVLSTRAEGKVLEFYSCRSESAHVSRGVYIPYPRIDESGGIDISERCYDAVVYMVAYLTSLSCGEVDKAQVYLSAAKSLLEL